MSDKFSTDLWCVLTSSFGGPLLAIVTVGGFLALGRSLIAFPSRDESSHVVQRNRNARFRRNILCIGVLTGAILIANIIAYIHAFGALRNGALICVTPPLGDSARSALLCFYVLTCASAFLGTIYAFGLAALKRRLAGGRE